MRRTGIAPMRATPAERPPVGPEWAFELKWDGYRTIAMVDVLERAVRLQSIARTLGSLRPIAPDRARQMIDDKYQDRFVAEYWGAWTRRLERLDAAPSGLSA